MSVQRIEREEVIATALGILGLDEHAVDLFSMEGICVSLRRSASFLCPASPRQIVDSVVEVLRPLLPDLQRDTVIAALELLVGAGDLVELRPSGDRTRLLYLGPPSYVEKQPGCYLILGIRPNGRPIVGEESIDSAVTYASHTRSVSLDPHEASEIFASAGLHRVTPEQWCKAPRGDAPAMVIAQTRQRLGSSRAVGEISGLTLIDPAAPVQYYKGRLRPPAKTDQGLFVGCRPQVYGAPVWAARLLPEGGPQKMLDSPPDSTFAPGWDEGRRLQAAIDAERGNAQVFRARPTGETDGDVIFDFFGPLPSWADRYLDLTGMPVPKSKRALFSYRVPGGAEDGVTAFLGHTLWMRMTDQMGDQ